MNFVEVKTKNTKVVIGARGTYAIDGEMSCVMVFDKGLDQQGMQKVQEYCDNIYSTAGKSTQPSQNTYFSRIDGCQKDEMNVNALAFPFNNW